MPIQRATYKDHVIQYIYTALQENRYQPGDKILESQLAEELGISRAPIREALAELVSSGLLTYKPQVGNFIASMSEKEIIDSYIARGILEGAAAAEAIHFITVAEISGLEKMTRQMEALARSGQRKELIDIGQQFHEAIFQRCQNTQIVHFTKLLSLKLHLLFYKYWAKLYSPEEIRERHLEIVNAIKQQDPEHLERLIRQHYTTTGEKVSAQLSACE